MPEVHGPEEHVEQPEWPLEEKVVKIYRCAKVIKGGRRFSFAAIVVVGDRHGRVGVGYGKANEVPSAVQKGIDDAKKNLIGVPMTGRTIPHKVWGKFSASRVVLLPASPGTGVIAGAAVRAVLELAGLQDVLSKAYGSTGAKNLIKATMKALENLRDRSRLERLRGVELAR